MTKLLFLFAALIGALTSFAFTVPSNDPDTPVEIGTVNWGRDYAAANESSAESGKPLLLLFQEVPGWQTCVDFGRGPMTNPLLVEAIEDQFVPVLVYNNKKSDEKLLAHFKEPSWNNPVIRYLNANEKDLTPRKELVLTVSETANRMADSLRTAEKEVPVWLEALGVPTKKNQLERATFAMYWYWEGEAQLGSLDGVYATTSAWRDGHEVVSLLFDPQQISYSDLLKNAQDFKCATKVFTHTDQQLKVAQQLVGNNAVMADDSQKPRLANGSDQKYYLANSPLRSLPMCGYQMTKLNAALRLRQPIEPLLSPRQVELSKKIYAKFKTDKDALNRFVSPVDDNKLGAYASKLSEALE